MNLQRKKLSIAVMSIVLGSVSFTLNAETQTDDEIINSAANSADIELNNTAVGAGSTDWEICTGENTCNAGGIPNVPLNGFRVFDSTSTSFAIGIEEGAGTSTAALLYLDSLNRVGINTVNPVEELQIESTLPGIRLNDTSAGAGQADIHVSTNLMAIENSTGNDVIGIELDGGAAQNSQLWLDSTGAVAVGKANPTSGADFEVGGNGALLLENGTNDWVIEANSNQLNFRMGNNTINGSYPFNIENNAPNNLLFLDNGGFVGIGTFSPETSLHVKKLDAVLKVEDTNAGSATRRLIKLSNKGPVGFEMVNREDATGFWQFRSDDLGRFIINKTGFAGSEFNIDGNGVARFKGAVYAEGIQLTSSRSSKTDITEINHAKVMENLRKVNVAEWRYKRADKNDRHISPMAEDFYSLFRLGPDNKHINPNDLASVAIIAAKELQKKADEASAAMEALKSENAALKQQLNVKATALNVANEQLQQRLASLEKLVTNLASGDGLFSGDSSKVALNNLK